MPHPLRRITGVLTATCLIAVAAPAALAAETLPAAKNRYGRSAPLKKPKNAVRVATYNVLNLFDHVDDPALTGDIDDLPMATDDARCRGIAAAIRALDADVIALQEVESLECLTWFRDTYLSDMGYAHLASRDLGYYRGVEQSVMSRFPITRVETWPQEKLGNVRRAGPGWSDFPRDEARTLTFRRSPLRVDVQVNDDYDVTLFVMHHKSGGQFRWQREMEAIRTIEHVQEAIEEDPARNVVVLGDFNAAPWDKSLRAYLEAGLIDTLGHRIIPRWKDADETEPNLYKTHESGRTIDYILLNSAAHRELVIGSAHVFGTLYDEGYDWKTDPFPKGYAADHYPVAVDLMPMDRK